MNLGLFKKMNKYPKISIITPTLNSQRDIENCILSVAKQEYENIEHIIVDGDSSDGTIEIIKKYVDIYSHITWISAKDKGIYDAMNKGISMSNGAFLLFLGSDDILYSSKIIAEIFKDESFLDFDVIYGKVKYSDSGFVYGRKFSVLRLMTENIGHQSIFYRKEVFSKLGEYDLKYRVLADWVFNMKWFNDDYVKRCYLDKIISVFGAGGFSSLVKDEVFFENKINIISEYFPEEYVNVFKKDIAFEEMLINNKKLNQEIFNFNTELEAIKKTKLWRMRSIYLKLMDMLINNKKK